MEILTKTNYSIRFSNLADETQIYQLYKSVAKNIGGIAREEDEITIAYITENIQKSIQNGIGLVIEDTETSQIVAEIHCYKLTPKVFSHVLSELTVVVHPDFQGKGFGKMLFKKLLDEVRENRSDIFRVELIARESNQKAIRFYETLGFVQEGRLEKRIHNPNENFEADIPMAWLKKL